MKKGLVIKSTGSWYRVKPDEGEIIDCKIRGKFRIQGIKTTNPLAVGDIVGFKADDKTRLGVIVTIYPRKNYIYFLAQSCKIIGVKNQRQIYQSLFRETSVRVQILRFSLLIKGYGINFYFILQRLTLLT